MNAFLIALAMCLSIQVVFFIFAAINKTDKFTDLSYGLTFVIVSFVYWLLSSATIVQTLILFMVSIWGLRLAGFLFSRILLLKKDNRFDGIRESFLKFARFWLVQAFAVWIILWPTLWILNYSKETTVGIFTWLGGLIWLLGLSIESFADFQKAVFKTIPENHGKWTNNGLWKYSRHPNYFGEMTCWWGIFIICLPFLSGVSWFVIIGPLFITFLLMFVTGIPPLEKKYKIQYADNTEYKKYQQQTSLLIPWFIKKN